MTTYNAMNLLVGLTQLLNQTLFEVIEQLAPIINPKILSQILKTLKMKIVNRTDLIKKVAVQNASKD